MLNLIKVSYCDEMPVQSAKPQTRTKYL